MHILIYYGSSEKPGTAGPLKKVKKNSSIACTARMNFLLSFAGQVEYIKKEPWEGKIELSLPLQKFHPHLPSLKILSLEVRAGQKITYKKYTTGGSH